MLQTTQETRAREQGGAQGEGRLDAPIYAALDLGTNNCRLLIASPLEDQQRAPGIPALRVHDSFSRIVRLGEGVSATGHLSEEAMERTISALKACQKKLTRHRLAGARFVATEACRRAENSADFLRRVEKETGLAIDIISSEEEAKLAFLGCSSLLAPGLERAIVFDIGGGSTELMWVKIDQAGGAHAISDWLSVPYGVMNLADKFGGSNFADLAFADMVSFLCEQIRPFSDSSRAREALGAKMQLLSTSGTVTTLAAIHLDLPRYDRSRVDGITLSIGDICATTKRLLSMRPSERFNHPCIGSDRADFIISGCAIFEAISTLLPAGDITIADRGVREGIILSLLNRK